MKYEQLEGISKNASRLVYGTASAAVMGSDFEKAADVLDLAWECGFTVIDSAYAYGNAEENLGRWMTKRGNRDQIIIIDKGCNPGMVGSEDRMSAELIREQNRKSLERLQTDHIDFYVLHRDEPLYPVEKVIDVLNEMKANGNIRRFGVSNWTLDRIEAGNSYAAENHMEGFTALSPAYSLADLIGDPWGRSITISGEKNLKRKEYYLNSGFPIFTYSSLARGFLSGKFRTDGNSSIEACLSAGTIEEYDYPVNRRRLAAAERIAAKKGCTVSQIALCWLLAESRWIFPIVGPSSEKHMKDNIAALDLELSETERNELHAK